MGLAAATIGAGVLGAGAMAYSGSQQSKAAGKAANAQTAANQAAIGEQQREFDVNQSNLAPWLQKGSAALGQQADLLGLGGSPDYAAYVQNNPDLMADYQAQANGGGWTPSGQTGLSMEQFGQQHWEANGQHENRAYTPTTGTGAAAQQSAITALQASPYYTSLMRNGQNAILANGSATGGLRGGNIENSLANFGADALSSTIQQQLANLGGLSGQGASTGSTLGTLGANSSSNISSLLSQNGSAQAGGILGSSALAGNGITGAANQLSNALGRYYTMGQSPGFSTGLPQYTGIGNMGAGTDVAGLF